MYWHIGSVCYPFCQMCRTFCAPCNVGVQTLFIQNLKSFDKKHVLHLVLKFKKKKQLQEENVRVISAFFTSSKLLENVDLYVYLFVCLDLEPCFDEVFNLVYASSTILKEAIFCHT